MPIVLVHLFILFVKEYIMAVAVAELISPQEYLELERKSETKHEYIAGRIVEMAGASEES